MSQPPVDVVVIGAGVVGLAAAAQLAGLGRSVVILEEQGGIARGVTRRNSGVIHAGLDYPAKGPKARPRARGRHCARLGAVSRRRRDRRGGALPRRLVRLGGLLLAVQ